MSYAIGIDLGGTNIKLAVTSAEGEILSHSSHETADDPTRSWANTIKEMIGQIESSLGERASWIGIAAPGLAAEDGLSIANMQGRLQGLEGLNWTDFLQASQAVPVLNDAHAALLGEAWKGAARGHRFAVLLTLGTGVGGAILADGRLFKGCIGRAGHLGHISLNPDGPLDIVSTPGSLEDTIGNSTLKNRSNGRFTSTRQLVDAHLKGDREATEIWLRSLRSLAAGLTSIINAIDPEIIILGGGIAQAGPALFDPLSDFMKRIEWKPKGHVVKIIPAALGDLAGPLGAIYNAMHLAESE
ncbi:MAG TPA: ROK family protein [Pyrinomonadaceae bacterium]|nr:ROK family protein [Pyrinomonadaceae bacterium]